MAAKFDQVQKYLTLTGHVYSPGIFLMNKALGQAAAADQQAFLAAAAEAERPTARVDEDDAKGVADCAARACRSSRNPTRPFQAALAPVYADFESSSGKANIDKIKNFR